LKLLESIRKLEKVTFFKKLRPVAARRRRLQGRRERQVGQIELGHDAEVDLELELELDLEPKAKTVDASPCVTNQKAKTVDATTV